MCNRSLNFLAVCSRHKWLFAVSCLLGLGIGGALSVYLPVYQSTAEVIIVVKQPQAGPGMEAQLGGEEYFTVAHEMARGDRVIKAAIQDKKLDALSIFASEDPDLSSTIRKALAVT